MAKDVINEANAKKKKYDALSKYNDKVLAVRNWQSDEQYWTDVLAELTENFPPDTEVFVTRLVFNTSFKPRTNERSQTVTLSLRTASSSAVNRLAEKLKDLGFEDVRPGRTSESTSKGAYQYDASITAQLPKRKPAPVEEEADVAPAPTPASAPVTTPNAATTAPAETPAVPTAPVVPSTANSTTAPADAAKGGQP